MTNDDIKRLKSTLIGILRESGINLLSEKFDILSIEIPMKQKNTEEYPQENNVVNCSCGVCIKAVTKLLNEENYEKIIKKLEKDNNCRITYVCKEGIKDVSAIRDKRFILAIMLYDGMETYQPLFEFILKELLGNLRGIWELENISNLGVQESELLKSFRKDWIFMGNFAEYFMKKKQLPKPDILTELSAARYEGSDSEARIYFTDETLELVEKFDEIGKDTRVICKDNLRMIRKLIEISKRNTVYLFADKIEEDQLFEITRLVRLKKENQQIVQGDIYIKFSGFMHWSVVCGQKEELTYYHGVYKFNDSVENRKYEDEINNLKNVDKEMIKSLVEVIKKQKHGTSVIISDYNGDTGSVVDELCRLNRGIRISSEIRYQPNKCEEERWNAEQILSITGIDGALFMDMAGRCLAIGVLVDGKATIKGDVGRGSRFNSINNYVLQKKSGNYIGIVVSEDGMIDVIQNSLKIS